MMLAVGLMSGTSLDGIDAALVRIRARGGSYHIDLLDFLTLPFEDADRNGLRAALPPNAGTVASVAQLHYDLGVAFAQAARRVAGDRRVDYVAAHGVTIWHDGPARITLQLGNPFFVRDAMQASVCYDFRTADCTAGGHGAPLVPYFDALMLAGEREDRIAVNIGGIANLTVLPRGADPQNVLAFDSGPGNMLVDAFVRERTNGALAFDRDGELARRGRAHPELLRSMLAEPYFALKPPKSTGRELFGEQFLRAHFPSNGVSLEDGAATLTAVTVETLARAIEAYAPAYGRVLVSGGGAHNTAMMEGLRERLPRMSVEGSDVMHVDPDAKEAIAFALLGYETLRGRPANVPRVTGAARPVVLGSVAPFNLADLLAKVESECRSS